MPLCHCGVVTFDVATHTPVPYQLCACSICRKVGGYGGSVNLGAIASSLDVKTGSDDIRIYNAVLRGPDITSQQPGTSDTSEPQPQQQQQQRRAASERAFCGLCSSMLWVFDPQWPELLHPFASVVDEPVLQAPDEMVCVCADSKPGWVRWPEGRKEVWGRFSERDESIDA
ncbi:MAG: hypothetical protein M1816_001996 [Peltula sp. TS41687]|nr:MAG: hypothetical protein M1816_001996 [Peltula sp. TS41687]